MEQLEYLIRVLTYQRSCWELEAKNERKFALIEIQAKIEGLNFAITEIYKLVGEIDK